jgi:site-specific recombinase XerD
MDFMKAYEEFLESKAAGGFSPLTIKSYRQDTRAFMAFLKEKGIEPLVENITSKVIRHYIVWLHKRNYSKTTANRKIDSLSSFCKYLVLEDIILSNPMDKVERVKVEDKLPIFLNRSEVHKLLYATDNYRISTLIRNKAIIRVFVFCGLRRFELMTLTWDRIDFRKGTMTVLGKGAKYRILPMNEEVQNALWDYLQSRLPLKFPTENVFLNRYHNPLQPYALRKLLRYTRPFPPIISK